MSEQAAESSGYDRYTQKPGLKHAVWTMPRWKKILLGLSLIAGVAGLVVQEVGSLARTGAPPSIAKSQPTVTGTAGGRSTPAGSSGFMGGGSPPVSASAPQPDANANSQTPAQGASEVMTPFVTRVGFSVFIGVVVGFLFRTFIKMAAGITALIIAAAVALSYFHILNIDMTAVRTETASASAWATDQAVRFKTMIFHALPSSTSAAAGFFLGFKRR